MRRSAASLFVVDGLLIDSDQIQCEGMHQEDTSIA
jgi:hypothetical protein